MARRAPVVAVCGSSSASPSELEQARTVGRLLAERGALVVNGGLDGVMAACAEGVAAAGGTCIGILPGSSSADADPYVTHALATGMGELRNALIVRSADSVIAIGGGWGTLTEIAFAMRTATPVVLLESWVLTPPRGSAAAHRGPALATSAAHAVEIALQAAGISCD